MGLFDPNSSNIGQTAEAVPAFQNSFQGALTAAAMPQKLFYEALMNKVNFAKATNPVDYALISKFAQDQQAGTKSFLDESNARMNGRVGGNEMVNPTDLENKLKENPKMTTDQALKALRKEVGPIGGDEMSKPIGPPTKDKFDQQHGKADLPEELTTASAPAMQPPVQPQQVGPESMGMPVQPHVPVMAGDPNAMGQMAGGVDLTQVPSTGTEEMMKILLNSTAMANRYLPSSQARVESTQMTDIQRQMHDIAMMEMAREKSKDTYEFKYWDERLKDATKRADIARKAGSDNSPYDDAQVSDYMTKTFGKYDKPENRSLLMTRQGLHDLMTQIDSIQSPQLKQMAMAKYGQYYTKAKGLFGTEPPPAAPAASTPPPKAPPAPAYDPRKEAALQPQIDDLVNGLIHHGKPVVGPDGMVRHMIPGQLFQNSISVMKKNGASSRQLKAFQNQFVPGQ